MFSLTLYQANTNSSWGILQGERKFPYTKISSIPNPNLNINFLRTLTLLYRILNLASYRDFSNDRSISIQISIQKFKRVFTTYSKKYVRWREKQWVEYNSLVISKFLHSYRDIDLLLDTLLSIKLSKDYLIQLMIYESLFKVFSVSETF